MPNYRKQRIIRNRLRFSDMGKNSQRVQAARRAEGLAERLRDIAEIQIQNLPRNEGDAMGCLQWTDYRTGKVRRWIVRIADRADRYVMETPDGRKSKAHGWTYHLTKLRKHLIGSH